MATGGTKLKTPATLLSLRTSVSKYMPNLLPMPEELGKSASQMAICAKQVGVFRECIEARGPHELKPFPKESHMAETLFNYTREHRFPIDMPRGMNIL